MFEVICIDDAVKPNDIPSSVWVKKGQKYTVIGVYKMGMQPGIYGYELQELDLTPYFPYRYFAHVRFAVVSPDIDQAETSELKEKELELV
jgi:hypothetical protein